MLKNYIYYESNHSKLHEFILAFFNQIENDTGTFQLSFFGPDFQPIVKRHPKILKQRCRDIYDIMKTWSQADRSRFCQQIRESNDIESICQGASVPLRADQIPSDIRKLVKDLFIDLYEQVLDGPAFREKYGTLREHFDAFRRRNSDITLCPICGISELKTQFDLSRDQYDHYLPKADYPLSSVNFKNLVPICKECNSPDCKGAKDTIAVSTGKLFFLFDIAHKGIEIEFSIIRDDAEMENIEWGLSFSSPDGKINEVQSWRNIYDIDNRYLGFVRGRIRKWYKAYWEYMNLRAPAHLSPTDRHATYIASFQVDSDNFLNYIRQPALTAFLESSVLARAEAEAKLYA